MSNHFPDRIWARQHDNGVIGARDRAEPYSSLAGRNEYREYIRADLAADHRLCVTCGRTFPASGEGSATPEACSLDMTLHEAVLFWRQKYHDMREETRDRIAALEAENERLRAQQAQHPGDMHWLSDDPEFPLECWSTPVVERWENAGTVFELMAAVSLPHIFVTERVLTVDEHGDPDETEPVWFAKRKDAEACYGETLARARAARG